MVMTESPTLRIEYMPLDDLLERFHPENPKDHDLGAISESIDELEYRDPVMIDEASGTLAKGHGRLKTLKSKRHNKEAPPLGVLPGWLVPVIRGSNFTEDQLRAYLVADNRITEIGGWHQPKLTALLDKVKMTRKTLRGTGFDPGDLTELLDRVRQMNPITAPDIAERWVTDEDIAQTAAKLTTQYHSNPNQQIEMVCPDCLATFHVTLKELFRDAGPL